MKYWVMGCLFFLSFSCSLFRTDAEKELAGSWNMTAYIMAGTNLNLSLPAYSSYVFGFDLNGDTGMKWTGSRAGMGGYSDKWVWNSDGTNLTMSSSTLGATYTAVYILSNGVLKFSSFKSSGVETLSSNSTYTFAKE